MTHLVTDEVTSFAIALLLFLRELLGGRPTARRTFPTGELLVSPLRVAMAMAVHAVNPGPLAFVAEVLEVGVVGGIARRDEALALGERLGFIKKLPLPHGTC